MRDCPISLAICIYHHVNLYDHYVCVCVCVSLVVTNKSITMIT